jgi:cytochrome P450
MALQYSNLAVALLVAWAAIVIVRSVYRAIQTRQTARKLGCRPPKKLASPWFGLEEYQNLRRASREKRIFPYLESVAARGGTTGTTFELRVLGVSSISTIEPENIKALLATQFNDFALGLRHDMFYPLLGDGIFTLDGAGWSHSRAILRPQFSRDQVR